MARTEAKRVLRKAGAATATTAPQAVDRDVAVLRRLEAAQAAAKKKRVCMWRYGDVGDSDVEAR